MLISKRFIYFIFLSVIGTAAISAQIREYRIHDRGMLHETVFNTGEIGRAWMTGNAGNVTNVPLMEWPSRSKTYVDGLEYSGQHNILGAGMYMAGNPIGHPGRDNRKYAFCGGVGQSSPEVSFGRWSFPLFMEEIENFPILEDGSLNPDYDPDEAEEIIKTAWASNIGVTVYRTSRAWSYPDYDDMIIYEYTLVYTGDTDGNPATIETDTTYQDFMALFIYGFAPSMYGYQRTYQEWKYTGGIYRGDQNNFWDADYWLSFNMNLRTNGDAKIWAKPEPNIDNFQLFAETGLHGGGLTSPQAPGYCILYYDTNHLARVDPYDSTKNESEAVNVLRTSSTGKYYYELDDNFHIKQPWINKVSTGNTRSSKMRDFSINPDYRWSGVYSYGSTTWPQMPHNDTTWYGRAAYPYRQSADAGMKFHTFGPYTFALGDTLHFAIAEVVGYGAQAGKKVEGGQTQVQWKAIPSMDRKVVINGQTMTEHYLTDYGYPDYVNSEVKNVTQVADKAFNAYLGHPPTVPVWPEDNPSRGNYRIPVPPPAPAIEISNTADGNIRIKWKNTPESFTHSRLTGKLTSYKVWRSVEGMGPWKELADIPAGTSDLDGNYEFLDTDPDFKIGESRYYSITSVDEHGNQSGRTNIQKFDKNVGAVDKLGKVYVVPNPLIAKSGFIGGGEVDNKVGFYALPAECTIRIFSYSGQLIETIEHNDPVYSNEWFQITRNGQEIASGIYFFVVTTPAGEVSKGKFIIIK